MVGKSLVRPSCFIGAIAAFALCAVSFVCFPVRGDNPAADSAKDAKQTLPKTVNTPEGYEEKRDSIRNLKRLGIARHEWADAHQVTPGKTDNLADPKSALNSPFPPLSAGGRLRERRQGAVSAQLAH